MTGKIAHWIKKKTNYLLWKYFKKVQKNFHSKKNYNLTFNNSMVFLRGQNYELPSFEKNICSDSEEDMWILLVIELAKKLKCNKLFIWIDNGKFLKNDLLELSSCFYDKSNDFQVILRHSSNWDLPVKNPKYLFVRGAMQCYDKIIQTLTPKSFFYYSADLKPLPLYWWGSVNIIFYDTVNQLRDIDKYLPEIKKYPMRKCVDEKVFFPNIQSSKDKIYDISFVGDFNGILWKKKHMDWFFNSLEPIKNELTIAIIGLSDKDKVEKLISKGWSVFATYNRVPPENVHSVLLQSKCLAAFSKEKNYQSLPRVLIEAMASDVPVLVNRNLGINHEMVCPKEAGVVVNNNKEELLFSVKSILKNNVEFLPRKHYENLFSQKKVIEYLLNKVSQSGE